jgi:hypothetical protein
VAIELDHETLLAEERVDLQALDVARRRPSMRRGSWPTA